jgi:L1 cell adhesion molecule like protein
VYIKNFANGRDLDVTVSREKFEEKCDDLFKRTLIPIDEMLSNTDKNVTDIDDVILVGGCSMMPQIKYIVRRHFNKAPKCSICPLEAVAKGAAILAGNCKSPAEMPQIRDIRCLEICHMALGMQVTGGRMSVLIERGTRLPATRSSSCWSPIHNQTSLTFQIYEGPWKMTQKNRPLGSFTINGIPPAEAGEESIEVTFRLDQDGGLNASARVKSGGSSAGLTILKTAHLFSPAKVKRLASERAAQKAEDEREYDEAGRRSTIEHLSQNFREFLVKEEERNLHFDLDLSASQRIILQATVDDKLPSSLGRIPSWDEIRSVQETLKLGLRRYVVLAGRKGIPGWIEI